MGRESISKQNLNVCVCVRARGLCVRVCVSARMRSVCVCARMRVTNRNEAANSYTEKYDAIYSDWVSSIHVLFPECSSVINNVTSRNHNVLVYWMNYFWKDNIYEFITSFHPTSKRATEQMF